MSQTDLLNKRFNRNQFRDHEGHQAMLRQVFACEAQHVHWIWCLGRTLRPAELYQLDHMLAFNVFLLFLSNVFMEIILETHTVLSIYDVYMYIYICHIEQFYSYFTLLYLRYGTSYSFIFPYFFSSV